tara:strand:- start:2070 stop:2435 length:366 start_codon:yes stop_codon:yes gene_type:complete
MRQKKSRSKEEIALEEIADQTLKFYNGGTCGQSIVVPGSTFTGNFRTITNASIAPITIDVSETTFSGATPTGFPTSDFNLPPGESMTLSAVSYFTAIAVIGTFGDTNLDFFFTLIVDNECV